MASLLNQHVLVLNRLWQAVNICTARRALTLLFQGHAQAVLSRSDGSFQTETDVSPRRFMIQPVTPPPARMIRIETITILTVCFFNFMSAMSR